MTSRAPVATACVEQTEYDPLTCASARADSWTTSTVRMFASSPKRTSRRYCARRAGIKVFLNISRIPGAFSVAFTARVHLQAPIRLHTGAWGALTALWLRWHKEGPVD